MRSANTMLLLAVVLASGCASRAHPRDDGDTLVAPDGAVAVSLDGRLRFDQARADAAASDARGSTDTAGVPPVDANRSDVQGRDAGMPETRVSGDAAATSALCARPTCGGDPVGTWNASAWCSRPEGSGTAVGTLIFAPDGTYTWTLLSSTLPRHQARPTPETGTWRVSGNMLVTRITRSNGVVFPPRGSLVYRGDLGASNLFCVAGDTLTIQGEEKVGFNWQLRRRR